MFFFMMYIRSYEEDYKMCIDIQHLTFHNPYWDGLCVVKKGAFFERNVSRQDLSSLQLTIAFPTTTDRWEFP